MRLFIAAKVSESVRENIGRLVQRIRPQSKALQKANWVKPENLHLTLKFLGEVREDRVERLARTLTQTSKTHPPFSLSVQGVRAFPRRSRVHILWAGVTDIENRLKSLAESIERNCAGAGFAPSDKPFSAHITFARFSAPLLGAEAAKILEPHLESALGEMDLGRFYLIQSALRPDGATYNDLREFLLRHDPA